MNNPLTHPQFHWRRSTANGPRPFASPPRGALPAHTGGCRPALLGPAPGPFALPLFLFLSPPPACGGRRGKGEETSVGRLVATGPKRAGLHPASRGEGPWKGPDGNATASNTRIPAPQTGDDSGG